MKIDIDATIELDLPEGVEPASWVKRWINEIELLAAQETYCVGWQVQWEPSEEATL